MKPFSSRVLHIATLSLICAAPKAALAANAVSDELASDQAIVTVEFSPDGRHAMWVRRIQLSQSAPLMVFYAPLEEDGTLDFAKATNTTMARCASGPPDCQGGDTCSCGPTDFRGTPQWGQAALEAGDPEGASTQFAVYLRDDTGDFVFIRADGADGDDQHPDYAPDEVRFVKDNCDNAALRQTPYPIRYSTFDKKWTVYTVEVPESQQQCVNRPPRAAASTCMQLWAVDLDEDNGCPHQLIYDEYRFPNAGVDPRTTLERAWGEVQAGTALDMGWFRWGAETTYLFHGYVWPEYSQLTQSSDVHNAVTAVMARVDFANDYARIVVTDNGEPPALYNVVDTFPVGDQYLVFGLYDKTARLATDMSRVYKNLGAYAPWIDFAWVASAETQIPAGNAFAAQSFEGFVWDNDPYVAYVILDSKPVDGSEANGRTQWAYNGEIWVQKLEDKSVNCVVSAITEPTARFEPEPIIAHDENGREIVRIYYNESTPNANPGLLEYHFRMITIADQEEFDRQCQAGDVWNY